MKLIVLIVLAMLCSSCVDPEALAMAEEKKPVNIDELKGASLGAPEEHAAPSETSAHPVDERDLGRDIIVKNANTDDEVLVSRPQRRPVNVELPKNFEDLPAEEQREVLHAGQRVSDFAQVDAIAVAGYQTLYFSQLSSFVYFQDLGEGEHPGADMTLFTQLHNQTDAAKGDKQIPAEIRALHGKQVAIPGFMLPSEMENGRTNEFLLVQVLPSCFFCRIPNVSEWIDCTAVDGKVFDYHMNKPVLILGTLAVGAKFVENDYLESIYRLRVDELRLLP